MALVNYDLNNDNFKVKVKESINQIFPLCTQGYKKVNYSIDQTISKPNINLKHLEWLIDIDKNCQNRDEAHELFMKNYQKIFLNEKKSIDLKEITGPKTKLAALPPITSSVKSRVEELPLPEVDVSISHEIKDHLDKIHLIHKKVEVQEDLFVKKMEAIKRLRKLVKKFPFERRTAENREIYENLLLFEEFKDLFPARILENEKLLEKLCSYAVIEQVALKETPLLGNLAYYLILKGSVKPLSNPHLNKNLMRLRINTPEPSVDEPRILVGESFGTITELNRELTTRFFRVVTLEDDCEFLKISVSNFTKVKLKMETEQKIDKYNAIKTCIHYTSWPKHTIEELMKFFEWRDYTPNTILTSEGYRCPFVAFLDKGTCVVLRKVDVPYMNPKTKKKEKRMKQVVIGNLKEKDSFGEYSCTMKEPMHCSIVTETECRIGIIPAEKMPMLDNITLRLFLQLDNRLFADLTQDDLYKKHITQEKKKEWKRYKAQAIKNVIDKYGIVQGTGKYQLQEKLELSDDEKSNKHL